MKINMMKEPLSGVITHDTIFVNVRSWHQVLDYDAIIFYDGRDSGYNNTDKSANDFSFPQVTSGDVLVFKEGYNESDVSRCIVNILLKNWATIESCNNPAKRSSVCPTNVVYSYTITKSL